MKPEIAALICCSVLLSSAKGRTITAEEVETELKSLSELPGIEPGVRRGKAMDSDLKASIIQALHRKAEKAETLGAPSEHFYDYLFYLGDEATVERYAREFIAGNTSNSSGFSFSQNPRLIELLAPVMFRDEPAVPPGRNVLNHSITTGLCILEILGTTPDFNSEVIDWARRGPAKGRNWDEIRELMREWWRENERHFKERNYKAVQPGRDTAQEESTVPESIIPQGPANSIEQPSPQPIASNPVTPTVESPTPSSGFLWTCAAAAVALLVGLLVFWKRRPG